MFTRNEGNGDDKKDDDDDDEEEVGAFDDPGEAKEAPDGVDPLYIKALAVVIKEDAASLCLVQRKCRVGYNHAAKIIEWMESEGYITPSIGRGRKVLITKEQFIKKYGPLE